MLYYFDPQPDATQRPGRFPNPFTNHPHPLARRASESLQRQLQQIPDLTRSLRQPNGGKMFGVLVVQDQQGRVGYLSAFSGMLNKQWEIKGFVPPIFDTKQQHSYMSDGETQLKIMTDEIKACQQASSRLTAISDLALLKQQQSDELTQLKKRNARYRQQRHRMRQTLGHNDSVSAQLNELVLQSQQQKAEFKRRKKDWDNRIKLAQASFDQLFETRLANLKKQRQKLSQDLHQRIFTGYQISNALNRKTSLMILFNGNIPPGGSGDCAAPKLLNSAYGQGLKPLALAEFWWGASPAQGIRHQGSYYPPCRSKCQVILPYMLTGLEQEKVEPDVAALALQPEIIYEDENLVVINKPAGLLSVPGKQRQHSVLTWLQQRYPDATGPLLTHRLDMATSGLLLATKSAQTHKYLQQQFITRKIIKRYVAILSKPLPIQEYSIDLPLRVDLDDRPRQLVCFEHGKRAITRVKVIESDKTTSRVFLYPETGRTHQLRIHMAHSLGLQAPIVGDALYGNEADRLMLHAEAISFTHPHSKHTVKFNVPVPF